MQSIETYFQDYDEFHKTAGNKICHILGIPLIVMTLLALLDPIKVYQDISLSILVWISASLYYIVLHRRLGFTLLLSVGALYFFGRLLPTSVSWGLFILGWVLQFVGHFRYEKKSPAFLRNLVHVLIGPAYIQNYLLKIVK